MPWSTRFNLCTQSLVDDSDTQRRVLFALLLMYDFLFAGWFALSGRVVAGHDTWQFFSLQYYFLGNAAYSGEIPQWIPSLSFGTEATMWYSTQGGLLQNVALWIAPLFKHWDFRVLFSMFLFGEDILLLTGTWLLASRFFKSPAAVFVVTLSMLASSVWATQYWFNMRLVSALPLVLHLGHRFLETGRWQHFFLFVSLVALQTMGNIPYFLVVFVWVTGLYFLFFISLNSREVLPVIRGLKRGWPMILSLVGAAVCLGATVATPKLGMHDMAMPTRGSGDGFLGISDFLNYARNFGLINYLELLSRISLNLDWTFYLGMLPVLALPLGIKSLLSRRSAAFACMFLCVALLSIGGGFALANYYALPPLQVYRHLSYLNIFNKLFFVMMCGFGVDALFTRERPKEGFRRITLLALGLAAVFIFFFLQSGLTQAALGDATGKHLGGYFEKLAGFWPHIEPYVKSVLTAPHRLSGQVLSAYIFLAATAGLLAAWLSFPEALARRRLAWLLVLLLALDLGLYRQDVFEERSFIPPQEVSKAFELLPPRFVRQWSNDVQLPTSLSPTGVAVHTKHEPSPLEESRMKAFKMVPLNWSKTMWLSEMFTQPSRLDTSLRIQHYPAPLYEFLKLYLPATKRSETSTAYALINADNRLHRIFGTDIVDRFQFYESAIFSPSDETTAERLKEPSFSGEGLFLSSTVEKSQPGDALPRRLDFSYDIEEFSANTVRMSVENTLPHPAWLLYLDSWHPWWSAEVNGKQSLVYRANIAFKAVRIQPGHNTVVFTFKAPGARILHVFWGVLSLLWITFLCLTIARIFRGKGGICAAAASAAMAIIVLAILGVADSPVFLSRQGGGFTLWSPGLLWGSLSAAIFSAGACAAIFHLTRGKLEGRPRTRLSVILGSFLFFMTSYFTTLLVVKITTLFFLELTLSLLLVAVLALTLADYGVTTAEAEHEPKPSIKNGDA